MGFLDQEISFDIGHLVLLLALIGFVFFVTNRCKLVCSSGAEGLDVITPQVCHCPKCLEVARQQALSGELYGCDPNNPFVPYSPEECNYSFHKTALHGCGVA